LIAPSLRSFRRLFGDYLATHLRAPGGRGELARIFCEKANVLWTARVRLHAGRWRLDLAGRGIAKGIWPWTTKPSKGFCARKGVASAIVKRGAIWRGLGTTNGGLCICGTNGASEIRAPTT